MARKNTRRKFAILHPAARLDGREDVVRVTHLLRRQSRSASHGEQDANMLLTMGGDAFARE